MKFYDECELNLVPEITDNDVRDMLSIMKPVVKRENRFHLVDIEGVHPREVAYTWSPRIGRRVKLFEHTLNSKEIITFHNYGYCGFFKPSLAEVCASIARFVPDYSMIRFFWLKQHEVDLSHIIESCHWCCCVLFGDEQLDVVEWENAR